MKELHTTSDIIKELGGNAAVGELTGLRPSAVSMWKTADVLHYSDTIPEIIARLEDRKSRYHRLIQPGGSWWLHVELAKAKHEGEQSCGATMNPKTHFVRSWL